MPRFCNVFVRGEEFPMRRPSSIVMDSVPFVDSLVSLSKLMIFCMRRLARQVDIISALVQVNAALRDDLK